MSEAKTVKAPKKGENKVRIVLLAIGILAVGVLLFTNREVIGETWELLKTLNVWIVLAIPVLQLTSYSFLALYYRSFFSALGHKLRYRLSFESVAALAFVNQVLPSGGLSGISYLAYAWRNVAPLGTTTMIQISRYVLSLIAYVVILTTASAVLFFSEEGISTEIRLVLLVLIFFTFICALGFFLVIKYWKYSDGFLHWFANKINSFARWIRRKPAKYVLIQEKPLKKTLNEFHSKILLVAKERRKLLRPLFWVFMSTLTENLIVYTAFLAIGVTINPAILILGFAAANVAGVISVIPGDVGVHELVLVLVLSSFGVDSAAAISAALLYRVFNKLIILPIGFYFYNLVLKPAEQVELKNG